MGKLKNGILGGFSGKVGPVVGVQRGGECHIRSLPRGKKKFTVKELENQARFAVVQNYLSPFFDLLRVGFHNYYTKTGGVRGAVSYTRKEALIINDAGIFVDPQRVRISGGKLEQAVHPTIEISDAKDIIIRWDASNVSFARSGDQMMVLVYNPVNAYAQVKVWDGAYRKAGEFSFKAKTRLTGNEADIYIGFVAADRSSQSDSQYLGRFII